MRAGVDRLQRERVVEVDVRDHRDRRALDDRLERDRVLVARHRHPDQLAAGVGHAADLLERRLDVARVGLRHRLHDDRRPAADRHVLDPDLALGGHEAMLRAPGALQAANREDPPAVSPQIPESRRGRQAHRFPPRLVEAARFVRRLLPGDDQYGDPLSTSGDQLPDQLGRMVADLRTERPSAIREPRAGDPGMAGALRGAAARSRDGRRGDPLHRPGRVLGMGPRGRGRRRPEVAAQGWKRGGPGGLGQRGTPGQAPRRRRDGGLQPIAAGRARGTRAAERIGTITIEGYTPALLGRTLRLGHPRRIGGTTWASTSTSPPGSRRPPKGRALVSDRACAQLEDGAFQLGRSRRLKATGAPKELSVCTVRSAQPSLTGPNQGSQGHGPPPSGIRLDADPKAGAERGN